MQIIKFTFALSSLVALLSHAAPTPTLVLDGSDSFEAREGDIDSYLWRRAGVKQREREDARAGAYAQTLAPRAWQYHGKDLGQDHVQKYHAQDHANLNYKDHPEQDPAQLQKRAYDGQILQSWFYEGKGGNPENLEEGYRQELI